MHGADFSHMGRDGCPLRAGLRGVSFNWRQMVVHKYEDFEEVIKLGEWRKGGLRGGQTMASRRWGRQVQQVHALCSEDLNPSP